MWYMMLLSLSFAGPAEGSLAEERCLDTTPKAIEAARALEEAFLNAEEDQFLSLHRSWA